jgi:DNA-binding response OmpR family regulator
MGNSANQATRILVVDRDRDAARLVREALLDAGFDCECSFNAAGALTQTRQKLPAVMIVDTQLDACSGFEFARTVRGEYRGQDIPVIFVSDSRANELPAESHLAGGLYFLSKPIDPSVLLELVDKALWMPHLIRGHIDAAGHSSLPRAPRVLTERATTRTPSVR